MSDQSQISADLVKFFSKGTEIKCQKGQILLRPEDESPPVYLIVSGFTKSYSISPTNEINIHVFKKKGDILPLLWALDDKSVHVYVETMSNTTLYRVSKTSFSQFVDQHPEVASYFLKKLVKLTQLYNRRIGNLEHKYVSDRLIAQLLSLSDYFGRDCPGGISIELPLTHQDLADSINSTRETISREFGKLEDQGLITTKNHHILICDKQALQNQL